MGCRREEKDEECSEGGTTGRVSPKGKGDVSLKEELLNAGGGMLTRKGTIAWVMIRTESPDYAPGSTEELDPSLCFHLRRVGAEFWGSEKEMK